MELLWDQHFIPEKDLVNIKITVKPVILSVQANFQRLLED